MDIQMQQESSESEGRDIRENLRDLEKEVQGLWYLAQQRGTAVDNVEGTMTATESALSDLVGLIGQMEYELNRSVDKLLELETRQEDLLTERDSLQRTLANKCSSTRPACYQVHNIILDSDDINNAKKRRDEARETFYQKMEELQFAKDRKLQVENQIMNEWSLVNDHVSATNEEKEKVLEELNTIDDIRRDRIKNAINESPEGVDRERMHTALEWLDLCKEERNLLSELDELEYDCQHQVNETTFALDVKRKEMKRLEEISHEYHDMMVKDEEDTGFYVRGTVACQSLPTSDEPMNVSESLSDLTVDEVIDDASHLHHCARRTDLHQNVDDDEYLRTQSAQMERNMAEYMRDLNLSPNGALGEDQDENEEISDVEGTLYSDTEVNLQDAALEFSELRTTDQENENKIKQPDDKPTVFSKLEKNVPGTNVLGKVSRNIPHMMESGHVDQSSITDKIRGRLGLNLDRTRGGSHTEIKKGTSVHATGSGTFSKLKKK